MNMDKIKTAISLKDGGSSHAFIWDDSEKRNRVLFIEALGSAVMSFAFTLSFNDDFARAVAYFMCFVCFFQISGAQFNPATSLAVYLKESLSGKYTNTSDKSNAKIWLGYTFFA
jgi:ABC-type thiamin/hydroxymethylpyrimidine transport system permease subunit